MKIVSETKQNSQNNLEKVLRNFYAHSPYTKEGFEGALFILFIQEYLNYHPDFSPKLHNLIQSYKLTSSNLEEATKSNLFKEIDFQNLSIDEFRENCNFLLNLPKNDKYSGEFRTPPVIIDLIIEELGDIQPNQVIYDPACGVGNLFVAIHKKYSNYQLKFIGQDINEQLYILCKINLLVNGIDDAEIFLGDSLANPPLKFKQKIDVAVCNPPFNTRVLPNNISNSEYAFIELMLSMLNKQGKVLIIAPERLLFVESGKSFRKKYVENDWIESIISLPTDMFALHSSTKTSLITFNFDKKGYDDYPNSDKKGVQGFIRFEKKYFSAKQLNLDEGYYEYLDAESKEFVGTNYEVFDLRWENHKLESGEYDIEQFNNYRKNYLPSLFLSVFKIFKYVKVTFIINKNNNVLVDYLENTLIGNTDIVSWEKFDYRRENTFKHKSITFTSTDEYDAYHDFDSNVVEIDIYFRLYKDVEIRLDKAKSLIEQKNYNLLVSHFVHENKIEVDTILHFVKEPNKVCKIKDLIISETLGFHYSPEITKFLYDDVENIPYVRVGDLAKEEQTFYLDISRVERKIAQKNTRKILDYPAVLVSLLGKKLKPTFFNYVGKPIAVGSDILILKMKEDIHIEFFLTQLYSRLVQLQLDMSSSGTIISRIHREDFLNIQIILPPIEEQQRQVLEMRAVIVEKANSQEKVFQTEQKLNQLEYEVIANTNHSLKNKLGTIINDYDTLVRYLKRQEKDNKIICFNEPIFPIIEGDKVDNIDTIEKITNRLKTNLLDASKVFKNTEKLQRQTLKKESVELIKYFREEVKNLYAGKNYTIEIVPQSKNKLKVQLDKDAFKDVLENLIENAKVHSFLEKDKNYQIVFELSQYPNPDNIPVQERKNVQFYAQIIYKNNGKPFPKDFSFEEYKQFSNKAGKTQGTGIGGYVVSRMIELHQGKFNFIHASELSPFQVQFEILLPLEN